MGVRKKKVNQDDFESIHQSYIDILNAVPEVVYWIDKDCKLKGCNKHFAQLFGLKKFKDFTNSPYDQMLKAGWEKERVESLRLDDMKVLFSAEPQYGVDETPIHNSKGELFHYQTNRVPLFDRNKKIIGVGVVLVDQQKHSMYFEKVSLSTVNPEPNRDVHSLKKLHVLMVEDNFIAQKVEEALLKNLDCQVDIAESGDKAVQLFEPGKYDIVLMDIGLEDTSGYMVAKKFRQKEENSGFHVPIIALTSYQADIVKYDVNDYFMDGVITKPLTTEQAIQLIKRFIYHEDVLVNGLKTVQV